MSWSFGDRARTSGQLGEDLVRDLFGLAEPDVEVKTTCAKSYSFILHLSQLEQALEKRFVFVVYDRGVRHELKNKKRRFQFSIDEAFGRPCEIFFADGFDLLQLIRANDLKAKWIQAASGGSGRFAVKLPIELLRDGDQDELEGHTIWNGKEHIEARDERLAELPSAPF